MSQMDFNIDDLVNEVAEKGTDQSVAKKGPEKLPEGTCFLRMFAYIELGMQARMVQGAEKIQNRVRIGFEVSGAKYPPIQTESGPKPRTIFVQELTLSQDDRSGGFKLFAQMNKKDSKKHFVQMLGNRAAFMGEIKHSDCGKYANLQLESIRPAYKEDMDEVTGDVVRTPYKVPELRTQEIVFVRNFATPAMWDALYIPGEYAAKLDAEGNVTKPAQSKNVYQERILAATDASSLPIYEYAMGTISRATADAVDDAVGTVDELPSVDGPDYHDDDIPF